MSEARRLALLLALLAAPGCATGQAPRPAGATAIVYARADTAALHRTLDSLAGQHRGVVGYTIHNVDTGERFARRGDETFSTASLIKVPILVTVYDLVDKKQLALDDPLTVLKIDKVPGSGQLQFLHDNAVVTVHDAAWLMSTLSDNTATNLLLDRIIIRRVWDKMEKLGLPHTKVHSKSFLRSSSVAMDSSVKYGFGVTTPNEMARLFALMADGKAVSPAADSAMLDMLAHNEDYTKMQRFVEGLDVPHKTGDTDQVRTECALFPLQSRVVACVLTKENQDTRYNIDNEAQVMMARMGDAVSRAWPRRPVPPPAP
ncbi:MAG: class A beta-lactamase-related serine hydrolase [Gemmatimonadota bacterium]|nr:class A beta-lactamase-related serine hydrolase [Gemmatimonadota bacterium]